MELLGDVGLVEACFGPFGDSVNLHARELYGLCRINQGMEIFLAVTNGTPR
jgi:hypothetical protein